MRAHRHLWWCYVYQALQRTPCVSGGEFTGHGDVKPRNINVYLTQGMHGTFIYDIRRKARELWVHPSLLMLAQSLSNNTLHCMPHFGWLDRSFQDENTRDLRVCHFFNFPGLTSEVSGWNRGLVSALKKACLLLVFESLLPAPIVRTAAFLEHSCSMWVVQSN
jgi:hypothetical protein